MTLSDGTYENKMHAACNARIRELEFQIDGLKKDAARTMKVLESRLEGENRLNGEAREAIEATIAFLTFEQPNGNGDMAGLINKLYLVASLYRDRTVPCTVHDKQFCECGHQPSVHVDGHCNGVVQAERDEHCLCEKHF